MIQSTYTTAEVSRLTGASLRKLQWMDEHNFLCPSRGQHLGGGGPIRLYSAEQLVAAHLIAQMRKHRIPLTICSRAVRSIEPDTKFLVIEGKRSAQCVSPSQAFMAVMNARRPVSVFKVPTVLEITKK